jgi:hypothetical protein
MEVSNKAKYFTSMDKGLGLHITEVLGLTHKIRVLPLSKIYIEIFNLFSI